MITPSDFDWHDREQVTVPDQPATAVYTNVNGAIVIRQERAWDEDSDTIIIVQPEHARTIAEAILREAGIDLPAPGQLLLPSPKATGAERQRRYRNRHRNGGDDPARHPASLFGDGDAT